MANKRGPEGLIQDACLKWLEAAGYMHWREYVGPIVRGGGKSKIRLGPNPNKGILDIMVISKIIRGKLFAIEVKSDTGRVSTEQSDWIGDFEKAGVRCAVVRSLDGLRQALRTFEAEDEKALHTGARERRQPSGRHREALKPRILARQRRLKGRDRS